MSIIGTYHELYRNRHLCHWHIKGAPPASSPAQMTIQITLLKVDNPARRFVRFISHTPMRNPASVTGCGIVFFSELLKYFYLQTHIVLKHRNSSQMFKRHFINYKYKGILKNYLLK